MALLTSRLIIIFRHTIELVWASYYFESQEIPFCSFIECNACSNHRIIIRLTITNGNSWWINPIANECESDKSFSFVCGVFRIVSPSLIRWMDYSVDEVRSEIALYETFFKCGIARVQKCDISCYILLSRLLHLWELVCDINQFLCDL